MTRRMTLNSILLLLILTAPACYQSGTWFNDAKKWERAFGEKKPDDVKVVQSFYWRSPHFTYEATYYFQIQSNAPFQKAWTKAPYLKQSTNTETNRNLTFGYKPPEWFAPRPITQYDIWVFTNEHSRFRLLIEKETGNLFVTDSQ